MRLLADENVERSIVAALRRAGHDVLAVSESARSISDPEVLRLSVRQSRVVVTNDKDFAELAFLARKTAVGILLIRMPKATAQEKAFRVVHVLADQGERVLGAMVVVDPDATRRRQFFLG